MRYLPIRDCASMSDATRNDNLRQYLPGALPRPHRCELSEGICHLPEKDIDRILETVADFSDFDQPDGEEQKNDFGRVQLKKYVIVWRFVLDTDDGLRPEGSRPRILQVMLADEFDLLMS